MSIRRLGAYAELGACMRSWEHVYETAGCMYADFGCMSIKRLGACMRNWVHVCGNGWVHVCGVGCMYAELGACL